jgi:hypothetical protein
MGFKSFMLIQAVVAQWIDYATKTEVLMDFSRFNQNDNVVLMFNDNAYAIGKFLGHNPNSDEVTIEEDGNPQVYAVSSMKGITIYDPSSAQWR